MGSISSGYLPWHDIFLAIDLAELCSASGADFLKQSWGSSHRLRLQPGTAVNLCCDVWNTTFKDWGWVSLLSSQCLVSCSGDFNSKWSKVKKQSNNLSHFLLACRKKSPMGIEKQKCSRTLLAMRMLLFYSVLEDFACRVRLSLLNSKLDCLRNSLLSTTLVVLGFIFLQILDHFFVWDGNLSCA